MLSHSQASRTTSGQPYVGDDAAHHAAARLGRRGVLAQWCGATGAVVWQRCVRWITDSTHAELWDAFREAKVHGRSCVPLLDGSRTCDLGEDDDAHGRAA